MEEPFYHILPPCAVMNDDGEKQQKPTAGGGKKINEITKVKIYLEGFGRKKPSFFWSVQYKSAIPHLGKFSQLSRYMNKDL